MPGAVQDVGIETRISARSDVVPHEAPAYLNSCDGSGFLRADDKPVPADCLATIIDTGRARILAVGKGVKQIAQLAAEEARSSRRSPNFRE